MDSRYPQVILPCESVCSMTVAASIVPWPLHLSIMVEQGRFDSCKYYVLLELL